MSQIAVLLGMPEGRACRSSAFRTFALAAVLIVSALVAVVSPSRAMPEEGGAFDFALFGDYPYYTRDYRGLPFLLDDLKRADDLAFVLHLGDMHNPKWTDCSEALYRERLGWFVDLGHPFVLTPGDNDWADCKGDTSIYLDLVRQVFFERPDRALGASGFPLRSQSAEPGFEEFVENAIWERGGVVFATLHMISAPRYGFMDPAAQEKKKLIEAGEAWLDEAFRVAKARGARGVLLAMQVSMWPTTMNPQYMEVAHPELLDQAPAFREFKQKLVAHARAFKGPIVVANGDTHVFRIDKPLLDGIEVIANVTRVEGFGSPHGHWVRGRVEPDREEVFSFREEIVPENLYTLIPEGERDDGLGPDSFGKWLIPVRLVQWVPRVLMLIGAFACLRFAWSWAKAWWVARKRARERY